MVKSFTYSGKTVFICEVCGFGYEDRATASSCETYCQTRNSCSLEITKKAVYKP